MPRSLDTIAKEINKDWTNVYFAARPYLKAMYSLNTITDNFGCDSGRSIVLYFLITLKHGKEKQQEELKQNLKGMLK